MARHVLALLLLASNTLLVVPQAVQNCSESDLPRDCHDLLDAGNTNNGVYTIYLNKRYGVRVWCDMETDGGGWTVFQKRVNGSTDFYRTWDEYSLGFGRLDHEFWLGNQYLHYLTSSDWYMLRVDIEDFDNNTRYSHYNIFSVGSAEGQYRAYVAGYTGDSGDDMSLCSGYRFSAKDRDYDANSGFDCAKGYRGGWWYAACHRANLNGLYLRGHTTSYANGVVTFSFRGFYYSLKTTKMMVRRGWRPPQSQALSP
ncbi:ryncolin-2-like [Pecten maximus]|uniref:ryncolin-2-like n=1 Tax=Pecten maximus TaxID=6579 RepID=UPI0014588854|nr:ryncolin-2-like [Pecten maximus]